MKMPNCQLNITEPIFSKQEEKEKFLRQTGGVIRPVEVLKHDSISNAGEAFEGGRGGPLWQIYIL